MAGFALLPVSISPVAILRPLRLSGTRRWSLDVPGVASWIFRRDNPSHPKAKICCFLSSFKTFAMLREATYPPASVNVLDLRSMAAFQNIWPVFGFSPRFRPLNRKLNERMQAVLQISEMVSGSSATSSYCQLPAERSPVSSDHRACDRLRWDELGESSEAANAQRT